MLRINKREAMALKERGMKKYVFSTTGHHKNWYCVESPKVLRVLREYQKSQIVQGIEKKIN